MRRRRVFEEIVDLEPSAQALRLDDLCHGDATLRSEVLKLLRADTSSVSDDPLVSIVAGMAADWANSDDVDTEDGERPGDARQLTGQVVDDYEVGDLIGRGGMSDVYRAIRRGPDFQQVVALKVLHAVMSPSQRARFEVERRILARVEHPYVARLIDGGTTTHGAPYLVMELVEGERIDQYCQRLALGLDKRIELFVAVCEAVAVAHRNLIVHRDLKPANILVTNSGAPKLLDFGIAKLVDPEGDLTQVHTSTFERVMTPQYASPEQVRGEPVTTASDVYSLGVLLFELVVGERPYELKSSLFIEVERVVGHQEPPAPSERVAELELSKRECPVSSRELRGDLDNVVLQALRKEPERRYGSVAELADDLRRFSEGLPVAARADTVIYRVSKFVKRHRLAVALASVILLSLVVLAVGLGGLSVSLAEERDRARAAEAAARAEAETSARVTDLLESVFQSVDPEARTIDQVPATEILERGRARLLAANDLEPEVRVRVLVALATVHRNLTLLDEAEELLATARAAIDRTSAMASQLGSILAEQGAVAYERGDFQSSLELIERALEAEEATFGRRSPQVATQLANRGWALNELGRLEDSVAAQREALEIREELLGSDHLLVADAANGLGSALSSLERHEEAEPLLARAMRIRTDQLGPLHVVAVQTRANWALSLRSLSRFDEAQVEFREIIESARAADLPDTSLALFHLYLALTLRDLDQFPEAIANSRTALELEQQARGPGHLWVAYQQVQLGMILDEAGEVDEARTQLEEALANFDEIGDSAVSYRVQPLAKLGSLLCRVGSESDIDDGAQLLTEALELRRSIHGEEHFEVPIFMAELAYCRIAQGHKKEARTLLEKSLARLPSDERWTPARSKAQLALESLGS